MALISEDHVCALAMATDPKRTQECYVSATDLKRGQKDMFLKSSASFSTEASCSDGQEGFSCHSLSDVEEEQYEEQEFWEPPRSRAATDVSLGDWWQEDVPMRTRAATVLTEYDGSGSVTTMLLEEDEGDDESSYSGKRRNSFSAPSTAKTTLAHSYSGVFVCPIDDDRLSLEICGQSEELAPTKEGGKASGDHDDEYQALCAELGELKSQLALLAGQRRSLRGSKPAQVGRAGSGSHFSSMLRQPIPEDEEYCEPEKKEACDALPALVPKSSDIVLAEAAATVALEVASAAGSFMSTVSSMIAECRMEDARHADSRVSIHWAVQKQGSSLW